MTNWLANWPTNWLEHCSANAEAMSSNPVDVFTNWRTNWSLFWLFKVITSYRASTIESLLAYFSLPLCLHFCDCQLQERLICSGSGSLSMYYFELIVVTSSWVIGKPISKVTVRRLYRRSSSIMQQPLKMTEIVIRYLQFNYPLAGSGVGVSSTNRRSKATPFLPLADGSPVGRV